MDRARAHYEPCQLLIEEEIKLVGKIGKKRVVIIEDGEEMRSTKSWEKMRKEVLDLEVLDLKA